MRDAILELIESDYATETLFKYAQNILKITDAGSARKFCTAARNCNLFRQTSKLSAGALSDLVSLMVVLPVSNKSLQGSSRYEATKNVLSLIRERCTKDGVLIDGDLLKSFMSEYRLVSQDTDSLAKWFNKVEPQAVSAIASKYIDTAYVGLLRHVMMLASGVGGSTSECARVVAEMINKVEFERIRRQLEVPRTVKWEA